MNIDKFSFVLILNIEKKADICIVIYLYCLVNEEFDIIIWNHISTKFCFGIVAQSN